MNIRAILSSLFAVDSSLWPLLCQRLFFIKHWWCICMYNITILIVGGAVHASWLVLKRRISHREHLVLDIGNWRLLQKEGGLWTNTRQICDAELVVFWGPMSTSWYNFYPIILDATAATSIFNCILYVSWDELRMVGTIFFPNVA